jgi:hypothetical protein
MTIITEHYSKEEGEGHDSERSGVSFTVGRDTVHVGDLLEGSDDVVAPEVSGRVKLRDVSVLYELSGVVFVESSNDVLFLSSRNPHEACEGAVAVSHLVETMINSFLLNHDPFVDFEDTDLVIVRSSSGIVQLGKVLFDELLRASEHFLSFSDVSLSLSNLLSKVLVLDDILDIDLTSHEGVADFLNAESVLSVVAVHHDVS